MAKPFAARDRAQMVWEGAFYGVGHLHGDPNRGANEKTLKLERKAYLRSENKSSCLSIGAPENGIKR
jgi:hypothetical protein